MRTPLLLALVTLVGCASPPEPGEVYEDLFAADNDNLRRCTVVNAVDDNVRLSCWTKSGPCETDSDTTEQRTYALHVFRHRYRHVYP